MKKFEDILNSEKKKVIKDLSIKKNICIGVLTGSIILTGVKSSSTIQFINNVNEFTPTKQYIKEIILDVVPISSLTISGIKIKKYKKDIKKLESK